MGSTSISVSTPQPPQTPCGLRTAPKERPSWTPRAGFPSLDPCHLRVRQLVLPAGEALPQDMEREVLPVELSSYLTRTPPRVGHLPVDTLTSEIREGAKIISADQKLKFQLVKVI